MSDAHGPRSSAPSNAAALTGTTVLRDAASGRTSTYDAWLDDCIAAESRSREECVEQLMNAVARGDLTIVESGG